MKAVRTGQVPLRAALVCCAFRGSSLPVSAGRAKILARTLPVVCEWRYCEILFQTAVRGGVNACTPDR